MVNQEKIHNQCFSDDPEDRILALEELKNFFSSMPDKQKAWDDLHRLTSDKHWNVKSSVAEALGSSFSHIPGKQQAWNDLHKLTNDRTWFVRDSAAKALGSVFSQVPDKQQAWNDLKKLTKDKDSDVRTSSNHSLGKVSIFKASQADKEEDYKEEFEKAICFFERASHECKYSPNPSKFCLPFYRSFHTIVFKKQEAREEVNKYLAEAKSAIKGSESKKQLFEVVENLAEALEEVQNLGNINLQTMQGELNFYRKYCENAAELMKETEDTAPYATAAMKKGLPILDRNLKRILEEIQDKAKIACRNSIGTDTEEIVCDVNREVQKWEIGSQEEMSWQVENLISNLELTIPRTPENQKFFDRVCYLREEKDLVKQYAIVSAIIPLIPHLLMDEKFKNLEQGISKIENSIEVVNENAIIVSKKLDEFKELKASLDNFAASIDKLQNPQEYLDVIQRDLKEVKNYMPGMKEQIDGVLSQLNSPSSTTTQKLEFALPIIPSIVTYKAEADAPKLVDDIKNRFKNLILKPKNK